MNFYRVPLEGKNVVIIGRSKIVGLPLQLLLLRRNATVTICHSKTRNLKHFTENADIVVVAIGKSKFLHKDFIKRNAVVIDVGTNYEEGQLVGDVDFESCKEVTDAITPVPGGVGPVTISVLLSNLVKCWIKQIQGLTI